MALGPSIVSAVAIMSASSSSSFGAMQHHVGNAAKIADVEEAMMRGAVVAGEARPIHAEDNGELLQSNVVDDGIEGALQEGGVDGAERAEPARGHSGGEDDRVLFGDADVEVAFGMMRPEKIEAGAVGHGGGDGDDALVLVGELCERVGEDLGVGGNAGRLGHAGLGIVGTEAVEFLLAVECGLKSAALLREHVQEHGAVLGLEELEGLDEQRQIVSVDGTVVVRPNSSNRIEGHSMLLAASSARRTTSTAVLPPIFSTMRRAESCRRL